ncbi:MAG: ATP-binding protein [Lachnospiraceae bacterium]|nr:ATP-binding protein [Lachnospiraceae bacterium]
MKELTIEAKINNLDQVLGFVNEALEEAGSPLKCQMQIDIAVEEIFVNIAHYAYTPDTGIAEISMEISGDPAVAVITFADSGKPYDPLAKEDPDVTLSADKRQIGGLGIYMVKKSMDEVTYEHTGGKNILTIKKILFPGK